jgi:fatty-acyl-CoA synthase
MALINAYVTAPSEPVAPRQTLGELLRAAAQSDPEQVGLICDRAAADGHTTYTYAELLAQSERCARRLLTRFAPGDRIAIWADNRPEWLLLLLGAALARIVIVTVNPALRTQEARHVLSQSRSAACFAVPDYRRASLLGVVRELKPELPELREVIDLDEWPLFLGGALHAGELPVVGPDDPLMIQFTSGTTGLPKGALLLHGRLVANTQASSLRAGVRDHCVWLSPMPLFHTGGTVLSAMGAFARRATLVLMSAWNPEDAMRLMERHRAEVMTAVPTMLIAMLAHPDFERRDLRALKRIITGGAPVPATLVRTLYERLGAEIYIVFGQTESGPVATMTNANDTPVGTGQNGEFVVRGGTMAGYFENEAATREAIDSEGWLHTGDYCSMDARGYFYVEGRLRDMIIRGGENIYPREIEELLVADPRIQDVAIVGLPDEVWGEVVAAFVVPAPGTVLDADLLTEVLRGKLARFKIPQHWITVDELPRTVTGKVQKFKLRDQWKSGHFRRV